MSEYNIGQIAEYLMTAENMLYDVHDPKPELIKKIASKWENPAGEDLISRARKLKLDPDLIEFYSYFNGLKIDWISDDKKGIGGRMEILHLEHVIQDWEGNLYDSDDVPEDADIRFFRPLDLISEEAQCGIVIDPDTGSNQMAYNYSGETDIEFLGLDIKGYSEMAMEARIFTYWPKVLLDIKNNTKSENLKMFKDHMPKIFEDFSFEAFAEKYKSLRK